MALQGSGAISFNDVNVELGLSGTATISLNDAAVRTLFGVASGAISMSNGYGKSSGARQWMAITYTSIQSAYPTRNFYDSSGNAYVAAAFALSQPWKHIVQKWNSSNTLQFSKTYFPTGMSTANIGGRQFFDSSGNCYLMVGQNTGNNLAQGNVIKIAAAGTGSWSKGINSSNGTWTAGKYASPYTVAASSSKVLLGQVFTGSYQNGTICVCCNLYPTYFNFSESWVTYLSSTDGTQQWTNTYKIDQGENFGNNLYWQGSVINSSGDAIMFASHNIAGIGARIGIVKLSGTDGSVIASKYLNSSPISDSQPQLNAAISPNGNCYTAMVSDTSSWHLLQIDPTTLANNWKKSITYTGVSSNTYEQTGIATDSDNNVYLIGNATLAGETQCFLFKFNNAGTLQFAQKFRANTPAGGIFPLSIRGVSIGGSTMYLTFLGRALSGGTTYYVHYSLAVPKDGSVNGTSTSVNYPPAGTAGITMLIDNVSPTITDSTYTSTSFNIIRSQTGYTVTNYDITAADITPQQAVATI